MSVNNQALQNLMTFEHEQEVEDTSREGSPAIDDI